MSFLDACLDLTLPLPTVTSIITAAVTAVTRIALIACDETAVMAGKNALSNDEDKSSTIPKQSDVMRYVELYCSIFAQRVSTIFCLHNSLHQ